MCECKLFWCWVHELSCWLLVWRAFVSDEKKPKFVKTSVFRIWCGDVFEPFSMWPVDTVVSGLAVFKCPHKCPRLHCLLSVNNFIFNSVEHVIEGQIDWIAQ